MKIPLAPNPYDKGSLAHSEWERFSKDRESATDELEHLMSLHFIVRRGLGLSSQEKVQAATAMQFIAANLGIEESQ